MEALLMPMAGPFQAGRGLLWREHKGRTYEDFDGVECLAQFLPIIPIAPVHVWNWVQIASTWDWSKRTASYRYRVIPIRWSFDLVFKSVLRFWAWLPVFVGGMMALL